MEIPVVFLLLHPCSCSWYSRLYCVGVGPWILGRKHKDQETSFGDAGQASGKPEHFKALIDEYKVLSVHNTVCHQWRKPKEQREREKYQRQQEAKARELRSTSARPRALTSTRPSARSDSRPHSQNARPTSRPPVRNPRWRPNARPISRGPKTNRHR